MKGEKTKHGGTSRSLTLSWSTMVWVISTWMAKMSVSQGYREAEAEFEPAITSNPNLFEAQYFYARTCFTQGKMKQTAAHWERAAEIKPDDYQSVILLSQVYHSLGQQEKERDAARRGIERAERGLAKNPENPRPVCPGAAALAALGESDRAREWAARALAIDPDDILTGTKLHVSNANLANWIAHSICLWRYCRGPTRKPMRGFCRILDSIRCTIIRDGRKFWNWRGRGRIATYARQIAPHLL